MLLLIATFPWIMPLLESFEAFGVKLKTRDQSRLQLHVKAEAEVLSTYAMVVDPTQRRELVLRYQAVENEALGALRSELRPGWILVPKQVLVGPQGERVEVDGLIQGPRSHRDVVIETKVLPRQQFRQRVTEHVSSVYERAAVFSAATGRAYQPMVLWLSIDREPTKFEPAPHELLEVLGRTGLYAATYDRARGQIQFINLRPFFVRQDAPLIETT